MKRRTFIAAACIAAVSLPVINYSWSSLHQHDPLIYPEELSQLCDEDSIRDIGITYRSSFPEENSKEVITQLILNGSISKSIKISEKKKLSEAIRKQTFLDFSDNQTVIINGWILSKTEALQCALFSLT
jgi:hypothetical protein